MASPCATYAVYKFKGARLALLLLAPGPWIWCGQQLMLIWRRVISSIETLTAAAVMLTTHLCTGRRFAGRARRERSRGNHKGEQLRGYETSAEVYTCNVVNIFTRSYLRSWLDTHTNNYGKH